MSYILDALRKAEKERKPSAISDLLTVQAPLPIEAKGRRVRFSMIVMGSLVISLMAFLWFGMWHGKKAPAQYTEMQKHSEEPATNVQEHSAAMTPAAKERNSHASIKDSASPLKTSPVALQPKAVPRNQEPPAQGGEVKPKAVVMASPAITPSLPESLKDIPPPDENRVYSLQELPDAIKQRLPDFSFSVFLYTDDPAARTVRVNGLTMKEGQFVNDGLKLEEIRPEGVIFSYMKYHFHVRIP